jgi:polar amino acid transport system substrate-binding protein
MNKVVIIVLAILIAAIILINTFSKKTPIPPEITSNFPIMTVGTEPTYPPIEYIDEKTGEIVGFDIDLIREIGKRQGFKVKFKSYDFDKLIPAIKKLDIDIIASSMTITEDRSKLVDFSDHYLEAGLCIAIHANDKSIINGKEDLKGKVVGVQIATSCAEKTEELKKLGYIGTIKYYETANFAINELYAKAIDAVIIDYPVMATYIKMYDNKLKVAGEKLNTEYYGFAIRKGRKELLDKINKGLKEVIADKTYEKLKEKHFK